MQIHALGYVIIESTDPVQWMQYFTDVVGLMLAPKQADNGTLYFKMDEYAWRIGIKKSDRNRLSIAGWELRSQQDFKQAIESLKQQDISFEMMNKQECQERFIREGVRLQDPQGNFIELFYQMQLDYSPLISTANVPAFETGYHGDMGLGHFVLPCKDLAACHDFYCNVLGFGDTDYMHFNFSPEPNDPGQGLHFLHANNPRHHSLALYEDPNPTESNCIHLMFEVKDMDQVGYFIDRCKANDVKIVSTLGRHTNDKMVSVYAQSPAGFAIEFGYDGVQLSWDNYKPTQSATPSLWGHTWQQ